MRWRSVESQSVEVFEIDRTRVVVESGSREQDGYGTAKRSGREYPQKEAIQYHGDETPIVILLYKYKNEHLFSALL